METKIANEQIEHEALSFAHAHKLAVISTITKECTPESAVVLFSIDDNFNLFFVTRSETRKAENIAHNKNVAVVIGTELSPSTLQINGVAEILSHDEQKTFIEKLAEDTSLNELYYGAFLDLVGINFTLYRVKPNWVRWLTLDLTQMKEIYYTIEPKNRA